MSGEREAFIRRICETPEDDTPRLIFADWLDEQGEHDRAELIRLQIKIAKWQNVECSVAAGTWAEGFISGGKMVTTWPGSPKARCCMPRICQKCAALDQLNRGSTPDWRVGQLLAKHGSTWIRESIAGLIGKPNPPEHVFRHGLPSNRQNAPEYVFRRGFPACLKMTWAFWASNWPDLIACVPLEEVELTTWPDWYTRRESHLSGYSIVVQCELREFGSVGVTRFRLDAEDADSIAYPMAELLADLVAAVPQWAGIKFNFDIQHNNINLT